MGWLPWALLSAFFAGLTAILAKVGVKDINSDLATAIRTVVILVITWAIALWRGSIAFETVPGKTWLFLVLSGIATGASWLCYFQALKVGEVSRVAPVDKLSVVFAILLGVIVLKEHLTTQQWLGSGLIVAGALVIALA